MTESTGADQKLQIGELFAKSFEVYRASFLTFWLAVFVLLVPGFALILIGSLIGDEFGIVLITLGTISTILALLALIGVVVKIVEDVEKDGRVDSRIGDFLAAVVPLLGRLAILSVATVAVVLAGYLFLIIPGVIALLKLSVAVPALFVERGRVFESMARSAALTRGNLLRVLGIVILIQLSLFLIQLVVSWGSVESEVFGSLLGLVVAVVVYPYLAVISAVLYFELRAVEERSGESPGGTNEPTPEIAEGTSGPSTQPRWGEPRWGGSGTGRFGGNPGGSPPD